MKDYDALDLIGLTIMWALTAGIVGGVALGLYLLAKVAGVL